MINRTKAVQWFPIPSCAIQIGTFIGPGPHFRGSPLTKISLAKENGGRKGTMGKACGGGLMALG